MRSGHRPLDARIHTVVVSAAVACLLAIYVWTAASVGRQHDQLVELLATERASQLEDAAAHVAEEFEDVEGDLAFALAVLERSEDPEEATRTLDALIGSVRRYRLAWVYEADCTGRVVRDPRRSSADPPELLAAAEQVAAAACRDRQPGVIVSPPIGTADLRAFRVFAQTGAKGIGVALIVDTTPMFDWFRPLTADVAADMLVLGPHGLPTPTSGARLRAALESGRSPTLVRVAAAMHARERGTVLLPAAEASGLGYPEADLLVVYLPIPARDSPGWSAATVLSTTALRAHERELAVRLIGSALAGTLVLVLLVAYVLRVSRTQAAAAEELRTAEQVAHLRYRAERILDHVPSGVVALAPRGAVTAANVTARAWSGATDARTLQDLLPEASPAVLALLGTLVEGAIATGEVQEAIAQRLMLLGAEGTWTVLAVPVIPPSPEVAAVLVIHDLTPVHDLQEQLLRAEKLATVGILAAGIAHEVGTPLGVIRGRAELVARKLGADHPYQPSLGIIVEQIDRIARTIRALLDFASHHPAVGGEVFLQSTVDRVCELVRYESDKRRVSLVVSVDEGVPAVRGDPDQLQQVVLNLVMNALDATPAGGRITLVVDVVDEDVCLQVRDTGHGIPAQDLHRIFDPFFTTKKRGQGTGLGLTIVNQIARDHGGVVRIESTVGRGTTVEVLLPATGGELDAAQHGAGGR